MDISPARTCAYDVLLRIETEAAYSSVLLATRESALSRRDGALCHELVLGTLRRKIYLDELIRRLSSTPVEKLDAEVLTILRMGIYQIAFLDRIPGRSAVNEAVNLAKRAKKRSAGGLVNAILRRMLNEKIEVRIEDPVDRISILNSHPKWLVEKWAGQFGLSETQKLTEANNRAPDLCFRFTRKYEVAPDARKDEIRKQVLGLETVSASALLRGAFRAARQDPLLTRLAEEGLIYFQDEASQIAASAIDLGSGDFFLDVCAAPGSKTTLIAAANAAKPVHLFAGDHRRQRMLNLRGNCRLQGVDSVELISYDATRELPFPDRSMDRVLIDAPCTGTGTLANNPEKRYTLRPEDVSALRKKQLRMLECASKLVKSGGILTYTTCSIEPEENEDVIAEFLTAAGDFQMVRPRIMPDLVCESGFGRTLPQIHGTGGFFIASLLRNG